VKDAPYRIVSGRTVIRCFDPRDAGLLKGAIDSSLDHLRPWLSWAFQEPQSLPEKVALLRRFRSRFDAGEEFIYGIFTPDEREVIGGTGLHPRVGDDSLEIGYWIRKDVSGRGLGTETTAALTRVAFDVCGVDRVEIRVDPANDASLSIPRKLGFREEATLRRRLPPHEDGIPRDVTIFSLFRGELAATPVASTEIEAYDVVGDRIL
jgi:RimJ/RimL family protein N-acetyltransferase